MSTASPGVPGTSGSDRFLQVEDRGIDAVPESERHGRARELGFLWAGAFVNYASLLTASLATSFFGLGVWDGLAATVTGTVAGAVVLGLLSHTGPRSGLPQVAFTRRVFGTAGMRVGAFLTLFLAVGWFAVDTVIAAQAGVQLLSLAGLGAVAGRLALPLVLLVAALSGLVAVWGHATIKAFESFGAAAFAALSIVLFVLLAPQFHWTATATAVGADHLGGLVLAAMVCFALVASWYPFTSDYSRYLPADTPGRGLTWWPVVGITLPMALLGLFGLLLPTIDPKLVADPNGGVLAVITRHAPAFVAIPFFVFVVLGEIWACYLDVYTAGLVSLTLGLRLARWQTALGCGVLGALLAAYAVVVRDFHTAYQQFLLLTYLWAPAWAVIVLLAFRAGGWGRPAPALIAWALGTAVSLVFVNYPNIYPGAQVPNQPLIDALHGADLSGLVSAAVAASAYVLLRPHVRGRE
ncbi:MAG TPA: cytosine permease [Candidatus Dormibacteraeota bacterium]|nr:cytosine permease [Candidatus Dormibacteraeota bacterium]